MVGLVVAADDGAGDAVKVLLSHASHSPSTVVHLLHHLQHIKDGREVEGREATTRGGEGRASILRISLLKMPAQHDAIIARAKPETESDKGSSCNWQTHKTSATCTLPGDILTKTRYIFASTNRQVG